MKKGAVLSKTFILILIWNFFCLAATIVFKILHIKYNLGIFLTLHVTFLTVFYHFSMRLIVGELMNLIYPHFPELYRKSFFQEKTFEKKFYKFIGVKKWKGNSITAKPESFDIKNLTLKELVHSMTQAEIVHEIIMILSFVPLLFIIPFGVPVVFILTSIFACLMDGKYVCIQRYNRPRLIRIMGNCRHPELVSGSA